jgi:hypothetical protein
LSPDTQTATKAGQRRGRPVVLVIEAGRVFRDGHKFYRSQNGVWLPPLSSLRGEEANLSQVYWPDTFEPVEALVKGSLHDAPPEQVEALRHKAIRELAAVLNGRPRCRPHATNTGSACRASSGLPVQQPSNCLRTRR